MTLAFSFLQHFAQCQADKVRPQCFREGEMESRCMIFSPVSFSSESRAAFVRVDTNKENIPSSGGSSSGSVGEDTGSSVDSQGGQSGHAERTLKPRKSKHSPTLVQLTDNQDAHAVSHPASSAHLFLSL